MEMANLLIGGQSLPAGNGATFDRVNPFTGTVATRAAAATAEDADAAVTAAKAAFPAWSTLSATERRKRLLRAASELEALAGDFIAVGVAETGGTPGWYGFNVALAADMLREAAIMTTQITGEVIPRQRRHGRATALWGGAWHCAVECAGDPCHARHCHATRLRQHRSP